MIRILLGNTLAYDKSGPFWMYFPEPGTVWVNLAAVGIVLVPVFQCFWRTWEYVIK